MRPALARLAFLLAALAVAPAADAQRREADEDGIVLGLRGGYALPFGDTVLDGDAVGDIAESKVPVALQLGYRFGRRFRGEAYIELAPARATAASCAPEASCSADAARTGIAVRFRLAPGTFLDPWIALGVGVEVLRTTVDEPGASQRLERRWSGVEVPLEAGVEIAVADRLSIGPYASASLAQYTSVREQPVGGRRASRTIDARAPHAWVQVGLAVSLRL